MAFEHILSGRNDNEEKEVETLEIQSEREKMEEFILDLDEKMMRGSPIYRELTPKERSEYIKEFVDLYFKKESQQG